MQNEQGSNEAQCGELWIGVVGGGKEQAVPHSAKNRVRPDWPAKFATPRVISDCKTAQNVAYEYHDMFQSRSQESKDIFLVNS